MTNNHHITIILISLILAGFFVTLTYGDSEAILISSPVTVPVATAPAVDHSIQSPVTVQNPSVMGGIANSPVVVNPPSSIASGSSAGIVTNVPSVVKTSLTESNSYLAVNEIASTTQTTALSSFPYSHDKKIIEFGSDAPSAVWVKNNVASMEQKPFDGVAFVPGNLYSTIWRTNAWRNSSDYLDTASLTTISWNKFRGNNFLLLFANKEDKYPQNLWDDAGWAQIVANMGALAKAAKDSGCAGILFDTEYYSTESPWSYAANTNGHTQAETQAKMEARAAQVMNAWQAQYPEITILLSTTGCYTTGKNYDLLPYWINGMLNVIGTNARIVDGDEYAYYYPDTNYWPRMYDRIKVSQSRVSYLGSANQAKYNQNVEVGKALNWDMDELDASANTAQIRKDRWEHNVYMSMLTADKWVWTYSGKVNWWGVPVEYQPIHCQVPVSTVPADAIQGITNAKTKYASHQAIGKGLKNFVPELNTTVSITSTNPVTVTATSTRGEIYRVDFYLNSVLVESDSTAPFTANLTSAPTGTYTLFALANGYSAAEGDDFWSISQPVDITLPLTVTANPTITSVSPSSGGNTGNVAVSVTGSNFKSGATVKLVSGTVTINGAVSGVTSTQITTTVPLSGAAAGVYSVMVTNSDGTSTVKSNAFTVQAAGANPTITSVSPNIVSNTKNLAVTITGTNFRANAVVTITQGSTVKTATGLKVVTAKKITCTLPTVGAAGGYWTLTVRNADGTTISKSNAVKVNAVKSSVKGTMETVSSDPVTGMVRPQVLSSMNLGAPSTTTDQQPGATMVVTPPHIIGVPSIATP